jgi:transposase-like protein
LNPLAHASDKPPKPLTPRLTLNQEARTPVSTPAHQNSSDSTPIENPNLTPVQIQVVAALAEGSSVTAAARKAGVHRTTVHLWKRSSGEFRTAVERARRDFSAALADELRDLSASAFQTLRGLLSNPDTPPSVRLRAALAVLEDPDFPKPGWQPGESTAPPRPLTPAEEFEAIEAEYAHIRAERAKAASPTAPLRSPA